jgi:hypothetical protein
MKKLAILCSLLVLIPATDSVSGPIMKPRKYFGPIPQSSVSLRVGFFGGASAEALHKFLDQDITPPEESLTTEFDNGLTFELNYMYKPHPQFGVRANAAISFLTSGSTGFFVEGAVAPGDTTVQVDYDRTFDSQLIVAEISGVYFFTDAAVKDFQPYFGGGFSIGIPHQTLTETRVDHDTGEQLPTIETDEWSVSAGVHAVLGELYYLTNRTAISAEGRVQLMESKFPSTAIDPDTGQPEEVEFVIDYTGFYLTVGITRGF